MVTTDTQRAATMGTNEQIGRRVHEAMVRAGMTQTQLAPRLGITQAALSRKLSGERPWFADELVAVAGVLGVSVGELFGERTRPRRFPTGAAEAHKTARRRQMMPAALVFSG